VPPTIFEGVPPEAVIAQEEIFGPVAAVLSANDFDHALAIANGTDYALTGGLFSRDLTHIELAKRRFHVGNLYINRGITGAIVDRQPFGGWKASSVGPGAKAGGPNYVPQLARWRQVSLPTADGEPLPEPIAALLARCAAELADADARALLAASAASYARAWRAHFGREHEPSAIRGERNAFRYRPCRRVIARGTTGAQLCQVVLAARITGTPLTVSLSPDSRRWPWLAEHGGVELVVEAEAGFVERLAHPAGAERVRVWDRISTAARAAASGTGVAVIEAPVLANGRLELRWYLREQTVSHVLHRYGNVSEPATGKITPS
jgi:RHH-type proline utilization regulon transcriptional repressor/proline dehydrogenase/delta 1-pyrroline-5-carboxylate dehydrogenase